MGWTSVLLCAIANSAGEFGNSPPLRLCERSEAIQGSATSPSVALLGCFAPLATSGWISQQRVKGGSRHPALPPPIDGLHAKLFRVLT